jgi:hypothetical protein
MSKSNRTILFITHRLNEPIEKRFRKLATEVPEEYDVYFCFDNSSMSRTEVNDYLHTNEYQYIEFNRKLLESFDYPSPLAISDVKQIIPGNNDLLFLYLAKKLPNYSYYWFLEYDVAFSGSWERLFFQLNSCDADLLGTNLVPRSHDPHWNWWSTLETSEKLDIEEELRGFFPIVRISSKLLETVHIKYKQGWSGHFEVLLPTIASVCDARIEDIGGDGPFVKSKNKNRFYTSTVAAGSDSPGTFIYRPPRPAPGILSNKLWHPVKSEATYLHCYLNLAKDYLKKPFVDINFQWWRM